MIDVDEALLIAATRLEDSTLGAAAARMGIPASTASLWRQKAEQRLVEAIRLGDLAFVPLRRRAWRRGGATTAGCSAAVDKP
ncbi:hypothetical protein ACQP2P_28015 [Dactylosporangium sp. CA-139114]|uniref:hypothetical protein n=1 Tax=Dactylosporangium sp. CA-139114 TaxID=3239931 RepID=UPI003D973BC9